MNTKQFQYVLTLAHEGSFSKAADLLNITQPSLSQYVKKIEKEIGTELFTRTNGDVRITDAGRIYIEASRRILDIEHQMENAFNDIAECKTGSLIIGTSPFRSASMMPVVAGKFKELHQNMYLVIREKTTAELLDGMEKGEFDLAITDALGLPLKACGELGSIIAAKVVEVIGTKIDIPRWRVAKQEIRELMGHQGV